MSRFASKTLLWIMLGVCLLPFAMDTLLLAYYHGAVQGVKIEGERFSDGTYTLESRILKPGEPIHSRYTARISEKELGAVKGDEPSLFLNRMSCQGARIYFNGILIGAMGDPDRGRANVWNAAFAFPIDQNLIEPENTLTLELRHEYGTGIDGMVLITDAVTARRMLCSISLVTGTLSDVSIGMAICGCIMIAFMILLNQRRHSPFAFMAASLIGLCIYALDYTHIAHLPVSYLAYKKIIIGALFLSVSSASVTVSKLFYKKLPMIMSLVPLGIILIGIAATGDMLAFKRWYQITMTLIPVTVAVWLGVIVPCYRIKEESRIFFFGLMLFLLLFLYNILVFNFSPGYISGSIFPYVVIYLTVLILMTNLDIRRKNEAIQQESSRRFHFYRKAVTDGLTGLYNREYMISHLDKEKPPFAVAMLDIDNFKKVNDEYGHQTGDRMIQFAGKMLTGALRETDKVGRYGGDEFIVILDSCGPNAYSIMERFRSEIANNCQAVGDNLLSITLSIGICYIMEEESSDQILRKADKTLYLAKQNGRNMVCMYE